MDTAFLFASLITGSFAHAQDQEQEPAVQGTTVPEPASEVPA